MSAFDDFQTAWRAVDDPAPPVDPARVAALRTEAERFDRTIRWRDWRETAAAAFVAVAFGSMFPVVPPLVRAGVVLTVAGAGFVVWRLWQAQRRFPRPAPGLPASEALRVALARVEVQVGLLRSVHAWYLLPLVPGPLLVTYGGYVHAFLEAGAPAIDTLGRAAFVALLLVAPVLILGAVFGFVYWLNQREVEKSLLPLRDRLARLLHDLTADA